MFFITKHRDIPTGQNRVTLMDALDLAGAQLKSKAAFPNSIINEVRRATAIEIDAWNKAKIAGKVNHQ